jgi:hypothetical protein
VLRHWPLTERGPTHRATFGATLPPIVAPGAMHSQGVADAIEYAGVLGEALAILVEE